MQQSSAIMGSTESRADSASSDLQQVIARVLAILRQRRWLFVFPLLTGITVALMVSLFLPRRYVVNALFERRDDAVITNLVTNNSPYSFDTLRRSLSIDLIGYNALNQAVDELALSEKLSRDAKGELTPEGRTRKQAMIGTLAKQLDVNLAEKSTFLDLIEVRYTGDKPDLGVKLVSRLKEDYVVRTRQRIGQILAKSHSFFGREAQQRKEKVAKMEAELLQLAVQHPGVDPADPGVLDQRLMNHNLALDDLSRRKSETESKLEACRNYQKQLDGGTAPGTAASRPAAFADNMMPNPQRQRLAQEMEKVGRDISDAKALRRMTDEHPTIKGLRAKLEQLRIEFEKQTEYLPRDQATVSGPEPAMSALDAERRRLQMETKSLTDILAQIDGDIAKHQKEKTYLEEEKGKLFERRQTFLVQQQELQSAKSDLNIWEGHVDTIGRVLAAEAEARGIQFSTVDDARRPARPISPTLPGVFLLSVAAGLALGTASVFLREMFDRSFRNAQSVKDALGIPVLETIGEIRAGSASGWFRRILLPAWACVQVLLVLGVSVLVFISLDQPVVYERFVARCGLFTSSASMW